MTVAPNSFLSLKHMKLFFPSNHTDCSLCQKIPHLSRPQGNSSPSFHLVWLTPPFHLSRKFTSSERPSPISFPYHSSAYFLHSSYLYLFCYTFYSRIKVAREQGTCLPCSSHHCILLIVSVWHQRHLGNIWCVNQTLGTKLASMSILVFFSGAFRPLTCSS